MNEKAKEILAQMLQRVLDGVDTVSEFAAQEVPIVVEQLLMWHMVESLMLCFGALLLLIGWSLITRKFYYGENAWAKISYDSFDEDGVMAHVVFTVVVGYIFIILLDVDWLKIWIAPKLYLLEYGASLIK